MKKQLGPNVQFPNGGAASFSSGIQIDNLVLTSGQLGLTEQGELVSATMEGQLRQAIANIERVLNECQCGLDDVVKVTAWLRDPEDFVRFNDVYAEYFIASRPARSTVVSSLLVPGAKVEIEAIAVVPPR